jgi:hypothetical protein
MGAGRLWTARPCARLGWGCDAAWMHCGAGGSAPRCWRRPRSSCESTTWWRAFNLRAGGGAGVSGGCQRPQNWRPRGGACPGMDGPGRAGAAGWGRAGAAGWGRAGPAAVPAASRELPHRGGWLAGWLAAAAASALRMLFRSDCPLRMAAAAGAHGARNGPARGRVRLCCWTTCMGCPVPPFGDCAHTCAGTPLVRHYRAHACPARAARACRSSFAHSPIKRACGWGGFRRGGPCNPGRSHWLPAE